MEDTFSRVPFDTVVIFSVLTGSGRRTLNVVPCVCFVVKKKVKYILCKIYTNDGTGVAKKKKNFKFQNVSYLQFLYTATHSDQQWDHSQ